MSTEKQLYALNLAEDGRVLSVTFDKYAPKDQPRVATLPEGNLYDYIFKDYEFIYSPIEKPDEPTPEPEESPMEKRISQTEADIAFLAMMSEVEM